MRRFIGLVLVAAPFVSLFWMMVGRIGLVGTLQICGLAALIVGSIVGGIILMGK